MNYLKMSYGPKVWVIDQYDISNYFASKLMSRKIKEWKRKKRERQTLLKSFNSPRWIFPTKPHRMWFVREFKAFFLLYNSKTPLWKLSFLWHRLKRAVRWWVYAFKVIVGLLSFFRSWSNWRFQYPIMHNSCLNKD